MKNSREKEDKILLRVRLSSLVSYAQVIFLEFSILHFQMNKYLKYDRKLIIAFSWNRK